MATQKTTRKTPAKKKGSSASNGTGQLRAASIDELRQMKQPVTRKVPIYFDDETPRRIYEAKQELDRAKNLLRADADKWKSHFDQAKENLERVEEEAAENSRLMIFKAIGRKRYDELLREHAPTEEQVEEFRKENGDAKAKPPFNAETFPQALVRLSCAEPQLSEDDIEDIWDNWNGSEVQELFQAAMEVNTLRRTTEMGE